jgi:DNA segregation ATPase FtsK/SpoIIIE, S-DNA-T family
MRLLVTVVCPATRQSTDVVLDADAATPMAAVAAELERFARGGDAGGGGDAGADGGGRSGAPLYVDCQRIWRRLTLAEAPIRDGSVISLGSPDGCVVPEPSGLVDVLVAGGPDAGVIHRIGPGRADIGGGATAAIRIGDPAVPSRALLVYVDDQGGCQVAAYPGAAATLDRMQLGAPVPWRPGQQVAIGRTLLGLAPYAPSDAALRPSGDGAGLDFSRAPRALPLPFSASAPLSVPAPLSASAPLSAPVASDWAGGPDPVDRRPLPVLATGLPLVIGLTLAFLLHRVYLLTLAGLSPVLLIGGALAERGGRGRTTGQPSDHPDHRARSEADARAALDAEQAARRGQCPDPATALGIASGPRRRLWERRRADPDYLLLRVGTADLPVTVELAGSGRERSGRRRTVVRSVPDALVTVPLAECGVIGLAGPGDCARALCRWLVASAALLHSPNDLRIYLLTDDAGRVGWEWVRWLPQCRPEPGGSCVAQLGNDAESIAARVAELLAIVDARHRVIRDGHQGVGCGPGIVVVLDGSRRLRSLPGVGRLLGEGPRVGVYAICLDDGERLLPPECQTVAVFGRDGLRVQSTMADTVRGVAADHVDPGWCARVARSLAPIRDIGDDGCRRAGLAPDAQRPEPTGSPTSPNPPTPPNPPNPPTEVWVASVEWSALGRPEPERVSVPEPVSVPPPRGSADRPDRASRSLAPGYGRDLHQSGHSSVGL